MKAIELTEEHKAKLLEMCNTLFPDDYFSFDNDLGDDGVLDRNFIVDNPHPFDSKEYVNFEKYHNGKPRVILNWSDEGCHFHWFEFCITTLATKIWNESSQIRQKWGTITMFRGVLCQVVDHPVDYLYEQFKKIENEKV